MHINICDTHDTIRGKMKLQVSATLLKIKSKSKTSKHLECNNCTFMIKYQNIFSVGVQFGHFLHIDADALAVEQHEEHGLDGGGHGGDEVAGDGLQDELSRRLLREPVSTQKHTNDGTPFRKRYLAISNECYLKWIRKPISPLEN